MKVRFGLIVLAIQLIGVAQAASQGLEGIHSSTEFLSPDLKAEQADLTRNRGMLWVDQGAAAWQQVEGSAGKSCASCHGGPEAMRSVATRYPQVEPVSGQLLNLEGRINHCRTTHQQASPLAYESNELLGLTALLAFQARGLPFDVRTDGAAQPYLETGRALWNERQGQLNIACAQCHDANVGRKLRGDTISSGVTTGYPVYRLEWQGMGSLHRRLRACQLGVRAIQYPLGSPEYLALELYLASRTPHVLIDSPALRR